MAAVAKADEVEALARAVVKFSNAYRLMPTLEDLVADPTTGAYRLTTLCQELEAVAKVTKRLENELQKVRTASKLQTPEDQ